MKRAALTAIFTLSALASHAGWDTTNAWPSAEKYRLSSPVTRTNVYFVLQQDVWAQSSTASYVPSLPSTSSIAVADREWLGPIGAYTNGNTRSWTNTARLDITYGSIPTTTIDTNGATNLYGWVDVDGTTQELSTVVISSRGLIGPTSVLMNVADLWNYDTSSALNERRQVVGVSTTKPTFYRDTRANLVAWKAAVSNSLRLFVNRSVMDSGVTNIPLFTATGLLASVSAPSNYFAYTPVRNIGGGQPPYYSTITGTWTISCGSTGICTNSVYYPCGGAPTNIIGTNRQRIAFTCHYTNIADGFTDADYGYKFATQIIAKLAWITNRANYAPPNTAIVWAINRQTAFSFYPDYASAIAGSDDLGFTSVVNNATARKLITMSTNGGSGGGWDAYKGVEWGQSAVTNLSTNYAKSVEWWLKWYPLGTKDDMGDTIDFTNVLLISSESLSSASLVSTSAYFGDTTLTLPSNWPAETNVIANTNVSIGYWNKQIPPVPLIRYDFDYD